MGQGVVAKRAEGPKDIRRLTKKEIGEEEPGQGEKTKHKKRHTSRQRQRYQKKSYTTPFQKEIFWEEKKFKEKERSILTQVERNMLSSFGFVADVSLTTKHNAYNHLSALAAWKCFNQPRSLAFHDLTSAISPSANLRSLLGLNLKFISTPPHSASWSQFESTSLTRFNNDFKLKAWLAGKEPDPNYTSKLHTKSNWIPPDHIFPFPRELPRRINSFSEQLHKQFKKTKSRSNLNVLQRKALSHLRSQRELLVVQCDKNLGPAVIERDACIKTALNSHLSNTMVCRKLHPASIPLCQTRMQELIATWLKRYKTQLNKKERKFIKASLRKEYESLFGTFYLTMKVHKTPLETRPIVSCSGSILECLGKWIDYYLQKAAVRQPSYVKNSSELKKELCRLNVPANAKLFTADAKSMCTNIPTTRALLLIGRHLRDVDYDIPVEPLMSALEILMRNNIFTFGDTTWIQKQGTAMGAPPAPPWATLYFALCENEFLDEYNVRLLYYKRFIDDILGIWLPTNNLNSSITYQDFQQTLCNPVFNLEWTCSSLEMQVDFMDLTLTISKNKISTTLYEKQSNMHLCIPPHSCHPPGLLLGIVYGHAHRIYDLCSNEEDKKQRINQFIKHLQARGYQRSKLLPMFHKAINKMLNSNHEQNIVSNSDKLKNSLLLHVRYHPKNIPSFEIQRAWKQHIAEPLYARPLKNVKNCSGNELGIERLIVAYNRPLNLGNLLSYRKIKPESGPLVSSYLD